MTRDTTATSDLRDKYTKEAYISYHSTFIIIAGLLTTSTYQALYSGYASTSPVGSGDVQLGQGSWLDGAFRTSNVISFVMSLATVLWSMSGIALANYVPAYDDDKVISKDGALHSRPYNDAYGLWTAYGDKRAHSIFMWAYACLILAIVSALVAGGFGAARFIVLPSMAGAIVALCFVGVVGVALWCIFVWLLPRSKGRVLSNNSIDLLRKAEDQLMHAVDRCVPVLMGAVSVAAANAVSEDLPRSCKAIFGMGHLEQPQGPSIRSAHDWHLAELSDDIVSSEDSHVVARELRAANELLGRYLFDRKFDDRGGELQLERGALVLDKLLAMMCLLPEGVPDVYPLPDVAWKVVTLWQFIDRVKTLYSEGWKNEGPPMVQLASLANTTLYTAQLLLFWGGYSHNDWSTGWAPTNAAAQLMALAQALDGVADSFHDIMAAHLNVSQKYSAPSSPDKLMKDMSKAFAEIERWPVVPENRMMPAPIAAVESTHVARVKSAAIYGIESEPVAGIESAPVAAVESAHVAGLESEYTGIKAAPIAAVESAQALIQPQAPVAEIEPATRAAIRGAGDRAVCIDIAGCSSIRSY